MTVTARYKRFRSVGRGERLLRTAVSWQAPVASKSQNPRRATRPRWAGARLRCSTCPSTSRSNSSTRAMSDCSVTPTRSGSERVFEIGLVFGRMRLAARDDLPRHADDDRIGRRGFDHDGVRADAAVAADLDRAEDLRARAHRHPIAQRGMALAFLQAGAAQRHRVIQRHLFAQSPPFRRSPRPCRDR